MAGSIWQHSLFVLHSRSDRVAFPTHYLHISGFLLCTVWWPSNWLLLNRIPDILNVPPQHKPDSGLRAWKIDKDLTGGAHWACCNGFMYQKGHMVVIVHRWFVFVSRW
jgi:hypothetical protein